MSQPWQEPKSGSGPWLWVGIGCGALFLGALCVVPPALYYFFGGLDLGGAPPVTPMPPDPSVDPTIPPIPGGGPSLPPPPSPAGATPPRHIVAEVTEASGVAGVQVGSRCEFDVTREDRQDGTFWCNAQVRCAGQLLYGGTNAGFFDCTLYDQPQRHVVGQDFNTTSGDQDSALRIDTLRSELEVRDDASGRLGAFTVRARITELR